MQITFDPNNLTAYEREILGMIVYGTKPAPAANEPEQAPAATVTLAGATFPATPEAAPEQDNKPKRGRGRPPKAEAKAEAPAPQPEVKVTAEQAAAVDETMEAAPKVDAQVKSEPTKKLTLDDCRSALKFYTDQFGIQRGIEVLKDFGASRISELDEEQYTSFIEKCGVKV